MDNNTILNLAVTMLLILGAGSVILANYVTKEKKLKKNFKHLNDKNP